MRKILLAFLFLFSFTTFAQFSKTHYIPPLANCYYVPPQSFSNTQEAEDQYLYISCPSTSDVNFKITQIGGTVIKGKVSRDNPYVLTIGTGADTQLLISKSDVGKVMDNKGFIVEADDMVYVTVRLRATKNENGQIVQAGGLVSKGLAGLGTRFRIGAFTNKNISDDNGNVYTFATVLATENNTKVSLSDVKLGVTLVNGKTSGSVILNRGESYAIAVQGSTSNKANRDGLIGALITSDKPIVVNCGSFMGTNGTTSSKMDIGTDQIVSAERTGTEYIFIKGKGANNIERPLIIADSDQTEVYLNGSTTPNKTLNSGEYLALSGSEYSANGNLYVKTSKNIFAYQAIGGTDSEPNQNMHFVPPLRCETPKIINNIPLINRVGSDPNYIATVCVVTETGADLNFIISGHNYTLAQMKVKYPVVGPLSVTGNSNYETYTVGNLSGNVSVFSNRQVYVSYFGSSGSATYGGFYSGFTFNPEISFGTLNTTTSGCIPNIELSVNSISAFDFFQWYQNGNPINGANNNTYVPTAPGFYNVVGKITACGTTLTSDMIPVSSCPSDFDNDAVNDNIDIDNDNDGIANCTESLGDKKVDLTNINSGTITQSSYSNKFTGTPTTSSASIVGNADGSFVTEVLAGKSNSVTQKWSFIKPISLSLDYPATANSTDWLTANGDFIIEVPVDKTITVLDPDGQLLIDTNYDGVYESGITQFSSFQVRFRLNNAGNSLAPGKGTFKFLTHLVNSFSITHKNLSEDVKDKATFVLTATCLPKDIDNDGVSDEFDLDDDNDGIPDQVEALGKDYTQITFKDVNLNGLQDSYEPGLGNLDSDKDGISNYQDLDSDNDGIYDLIEANHKALDANLDGMIDGSSSVFGSNGLFNDLETSVDSGIINYTIVSTDTDGFQNYIDSDSDNDGCFDVVEAGFSDSDGDGILGNNPVLVNALGKVTSNTDGYTVLANNNYVTGTPINITTQPTDQSVCENQTAAFDIVSTDVDSYQWQMSTDGINFINIVDNRNYSGSLTSALKLKDITLAMNGYKYRVQLIKNGNSCDAKSSIATLKVMALPAVATNVTLTQCDDDNDGSTNFNLKQIENQIYPDYASVTFTYFTSDAGAQNNDSKFRINNPTVYKSKDGMVWARIENANGCYNISQMNLKVSTTQIPTGTVFKYYACDDYIDLQNDDNDGIETFDFHAATNQTTDLLPTNATYNVTYFKTQQEALQETDEQGNSLAISDITQYRNVGYPNQENIWVRIDSSIPNSCVGLGTYVQLNVNPLPKIELTHDNVICKDGANTTVELNAGLLSGSKSEYSYQWYKTDDKLDGEQGYNYTANSEGIYTCSVTENATQCERTRTENVITSVPAIINDVQVDDLTDDNSVTISVSGNGKYEYSLDNESGPFQDSKLFENVEMGIHTVYVNDKNGCGKTSQTIAVVGAPKFFTPNNDGYNDFWKPKGISSKFNQKTMVYIFDRFGKLVGQIANGGSEGWDGTYNGNQLPADDYWFVIQMEDGREAKGHFALKR